MRSSGQRELRSRTSKTEKIASIFSDEPLDYHTPKEISLKLDMDIRLVTSIVNRLKAEGLVERIGRGRYRLKMDQEIDEETISGIRGELASMSQVILGIPGRDEKDRMNTTPFKQLVSLYMMVDNIGGRTMARNLLRLSGKKYLDDDSVDRLLLSVEEVT
ncbi:MAG: hypothetical protein ACMUIE_08770 [Thermoplasmatota archaeon]